jgi:hypothetical protein
MTRVTGIGGIFFKAKDPDALRAPDRSASSDGSWTPSGTGSSCGSRPRGRFPG